MNWALDPEGPGVWGLERSSLSKEVAVQLLLILPFGNENPGVINVLIYYLF